LFPVKDNLPTDRFPVVTVALIVANVLVYFLLQQGGWEITSNATGDWSLEEYAAIPCDLSGASGCQVPRGHIDEIASVFTSMFMHGGILHLGGNMLFLWIFGNNVEDAMGRVKFVGFYLLGGVAAIALQTIIDTQANVPTVGASGAVSAVLGGYILLFPRQRVITVIFIVLFFTFLELPALLVIGFWFLQQVVFGYLDYASGAGEGGGVAYFAHIGGFVFGLLTIRLLARRPRRTRPAPYRV